MEKVWAIVSQDEKKVHRLTFSQSLATHIVKTNPQYKVKRLGYKLGRRLSLGDKSDSGLYALVSNKGDIALRISLIKGVSELHYDKTSRYLAEAWIL